MLDARRLLVLREVARRGSLSAAADALTYTTSAVSQQVAALEREVGMRLLERRARGVVLTEAGRLLLTHAERIFDELDAAEAALADLAALRRGRVRLASFATAAASVVPAVIDAFRARYPAIEIQVDQATSTDGIERLRRGRHDLVLAVDQPAHPDLEVVPLFADPFRLALPRAHPRAADAELRLPELAGEQWIDVPRDIPGGGVVFRTLGPGVRIASESDDYTAIHAMVGAGLGLALLPDLALFPDNPDVVLRELGAPVPSRQVQAVTRLPEFRSPAATALLEVLREFVPRSRVQADARSAPSRYAGT